MFASFFTEKIFAKMFDTLYQLIVRVIVPFTFDLNEISLTSDSPEAEHDGYEMRYSHPVNMRYTVSERTECSMARTNGEVHGLEVEECIKCGTVYADAVVCHQFDNQMMILAPDQPAVT